MYKITATIIKAGNPPVDWCRFSEEKLTQAQCEKMLFKEKEAGKSFGDSVTLEDFRCEKVLKRLTEKSLPFDMRVPNELITRTTEDSRDEADIQTTEDEDDLFNQLGI